MVYAFDTLGYAKRLRDGGVAGEQAEAHAEAARDFIMAELFTKADALGLRQELDGRFAALEIRFVALDARFAVIESKIDTLGLRLTVRLGAILAAAVALLAALQKLS
jgi:hypothetical protein